MHLFEVDVSLTINKCVLKVSIWSSLEEITFSKKLFYFFEKLEKREKNELSLIETVLTVLLKLYCAFNAI